MTALRHQAITASAGSGKTFQLAHRYLRLLVDGVSPDRVVALTFSRKAAGEIFDSIMTYLQEAASSDAAAALMCDRLGHESVDRRRFLELLRVMTRATHRLHIGTLDSFAVGILRTFPMELGIGSELNLMESDGAAAATLRQEVLAHVYDHRSVDRDAQDEFREAFKQATFGVEEKGLSRGLERLILENHERFMGYPRGELWGNPRVIWPLGFPWQTPNDDEVAAALVEVEQAVEEGALQAGFGKTLLSFAERAAAHNLHQAWEGKLEGKVFGEFIRLADDLDHGPVRVNYNRKEHTLNGPLAAACSTLLSHLFHVELTRSLERTRGLYRLLAQYESYYDDLVRRRGYLTFHDAQYLLTPLREGMGGVTLSRFEEDPARLYIDYRLDAKLDHWLLDEFQDTSDLQWEVFRNLADEILQDTSGERSFFYVGDVKQAIYGWRGGNARLFDRILETYGPDGIEQVPMNTSYRSAQAILDVVNQSFADFASFDLPPETVVRWEQTWAEHTASPMVPERGYVAILEPDSAGGREKPGKEDTFELAAELLKDLDPVGRGLETAILLRTNSNVTAMVDLLRERVPGLPVADEGRTAIADNPVVNLLLALVKAAYHPGDVLARRHLRMSPLARVLEKETGGSASSLTLRLLDDIHDHGFQGALRAWGARLDQVVGLDAFGSKRLQDLVEAAGAFDQSGPSGGRMFIEFVRQRTIHEFGVQRSVRVMTIHQAKGLGFDVVVLPDFQEMDLKSKGRFGEFLVAEEEETRLPKWVLSAPRKCISENDPELAPVFQEKESRACFENLCGMYVAMTRAKRALYLVTAYPGARSSRVTAGGVVKTHLCGDPACLEGEPVQVGGLSAVRLFEHGDPAYVEDVEPFPEPSAGEGADETALPAPWKKQRMARMTPSEEAEEEKSGGELFGATGKQAREEGTALHALFEQVEWSDGADVDGMLKELGTRITPEVVERVAPEFRAALASPEVRAALACPGEGAEVWREKTIELIHEERWVTAQCDRVTIVRNAQGGVRSVTVLDYKSNRIEDEEHLLKTVEHYRPQLDLYARALGRLLGVEAGAVKKQLLFTKPGRVVNL